MKLRISYFNPTVLRKDLTRFLPLWGLLLLLQLLNFLTVTTALKPDYLAASVAVDIPGHGISQFVFGGLCALLVFGDLFKSRAAGTLHALPLRREGWFFTHTVAAILIYLPAMFLPKLLYLTVLKDFWPLALMSAAVEFGMFLFSFSVAAFAIQCAGTWFGAVTVYAILSFLTRLVSYLGVSLIQPHLYGTLLDHPILQTLCPAVSCNARSFVIVTGGYEEVGFHQEYVAHYHGIVPGDWWYLLAVVAVGAVFWVLALLLYRRRHIETAGNFISARFMAVGFLGLLTLLAGALFFSVGGESYILLLIGLAVGFFAGLMLLEKRLRVFRKKAWFALGILAVALFATIGIVWADPLGVVNYVPAPEEVEAVSLTDDQYQFSSQGRYEQITLDTAEELELLADFHAGLIGEKDNALISPAARKELYLTYTLKNGRTVRRAYPFPEKGDLRKQAYKILSRLDIFETPANLRQVVSIRYDHNYDTGALPEFEIHAMPLGADGNFTPLMDIEINSSTLLDQNPMALAMWEALEKDCKAGNMCQRFDAHSDSMGYLQITFLDQYGVEETVVFYIFSECTNFRNFLLSAYKYQ